MKTTWKTTIQGKQISKTLFDSEGEQTRKHLFDSEGKKKTI